MTRSLPLRLSLPLSLAVLGLALTIAADLHDRLTSVRSLETVVERRAVATGHLAASALEEAQLEGRPADGQEQLDRLALMPNLSRALALDADDRVLFATDHTQRGRALADTPAATARALVARARASEAAQEELSADRSTIRVAAPFRLAPLPGELRPSRIGVLYAETDLSWRKREAAAQRRERALLMGGVLLLASALGWAFLRVTFTRHLDRLNAAMAAASVGDSEVRVPEDGSPELARIGHVFNRRLAELSAQHAAMRESEEKFSRIFHGAPALVCLAELDKGRFLEVNEEMVRATGYSREELVGRSPVEMGWIDPALIGTLLERLKAGERIDGLDLQLRTRAGQVVECVGSGEVIAIGGQRRLLAIVQDTTARHRVERELRESEERFRHLAEASTDLISRHAPDAVFLYASPACRQLLGYEPEEVVGHSAYEIVVPEDVEAVRRWHAAVLESLEPRTVSYRLRRKDGSPIWVESTSHGIPDATGAITQIHVTTRDISDRKRAEEEHARLQAMLIQAQKMEAVGHLAGGVAHDFNNILTAMLMNVDALTADPHLAPETRIGLEELAEDARRAAALTRQLLTFSRRQVMQVRALELNGLLTNLLRMLRRLIGETVALELVAGGGELWLQADPGMLEQAVANLVVNARDAMPGGGRIVLRTRALELDAAAASRNPEARAGRLACLEVSDSGTGMDEETARRAFEPFFTTKGVGKGTGLGLATVYGIVKQHDGWIELETGPGKGASFRLYFPQATAPAETGAEETERPLGGGERILLAEDEAVVRRIVVRTLERLGYRVEVAATGVEAVERWRAAAGGFDLLVTDMVMPGGMTGLDLAERLRQDRPELKVIVMSGYSPELANTAVVARARVMHVPKPFEARVLARRVRDALDGT